MPGAFFVRGANDHSVRGTEDYLTARAANPFTGLISPSVYTPPATPTTPRTPGEALALRGDFSKTPDRDDRRPSGAEMLNEHFGLGKKKKGSPLKKSGGGLFSKIDDFRSSVSSTSSSKSATTIAPGSPQSVTSRGMDSDVSSITSSECNFIVQKMEMKKVVDTIEDKENSPPTPAGQQTSDSRFRSGTIMRVAAHWSGIKESLQASGVSPKIEPATPATPTNKSGGPFNSERLRDMRCLDDDGHQSSSSGVSPLTKRPPPRPQNHKEHVVTSTKPAVATKKLNQLPSVRLVHPTLAAIPGADRKADRVVELSELLMQNEDKEAVKIKKPQHKKSAVVDDVLSTSQLRTEVDLPVIHVPKCISGGLMALMRLLIGSYPVNGGPGSGSLFDGIVALIRLLVLAYLVYCAWLVFGLIADIIQAICWPFRIISKFVEWSIRS